MEQLRVLLRFYLGLPHRQADDSEKKRFDASISEIFKEWRSSGIELAGTFMALGSVNGYAHYAIFDVDNLELVKKMNGDIRTFEGSKYIERYDIEIGWPQTWIEEVWAD